MPIFYVNKKYENYENDDLDSIIGLHFPKDETQKKTNFLTNLKKQNIIETKMFSLTQSKEDSNKVDILFGTLPKSEINSNKNHFLKCPMVNRRFECNFKNILINELNYEIKNGKFQFSLDERYIICPLKFLNYLNIALLTDIKVIDNCKFTLVNEFSYSIICENDAFKYLKDIKIILDDKSEIIFENKNLFFERKDGKYQFIMSSCKDDIEDNNNFIFGYNFFTIFDGIIDLDREILGIYHSTYINSSNAYNSFNYPIEIKVNNYNSIKKYSILCCIIFFFILQIIIIRYNGKKKFENNKLLNDKELEEI